MDAEWTTWLPQGSSFAHPPAADPSRPPSASGRTHFFLSPSCRLHPRQFEHGVAFWWTHKWSYWGAIKIRIAKWHLFPPSWWPWLPKRGKRIHVNRTGLGHNQNSKNGHWEVSRPQRAQQVPLSGRNRLTDWPSLNKAYMVIYATCQNHIFLCIFVHQPSDFLDNRRTNLAWGKNPRQWPIIDPP